MSNIPWPESSLNSLCSRIGDGVHGTPRYVESSEYPFINGNNLKQGFIRIFPQTKKVDRSEFEKYFIEFDENTLFLSINGTLGSLAKYRGESVILGKSVAYINCSKINVDFLYYYLQLEHIQQQIWNVATGSTIKNLSLASIRSLQIPTPPAADQQKIAAVLSALDAKIDCNNRINAQLEMMAKTLYDYWFVQFDFLDANGKPYKSSGGKMLYNATLKREIPAGWEDKQLSQIANITMGQSPVGESLNDSGEGVEFFQGSTDFGWQFPTVRQYTTQPTRMAKSGDILLSVRAPVGDMNIAHLDCCIGRGLAALNSKDGFDGFLFYVMQYFKTVFDRRNSEGTTFGSITKDDLHSLPLAYPPTELLTEYDKVVTRYNQMVFTRSMENQHLTQLRDWLLPMLMNGQVTAA
ncbi:restriction endonuclease subunit S [Pseudomonas viridiflava]|uniref:restriction endonuclease subunit S n=1 Tax=Pseudomonas viridiflava TaxID=33069 RepID=UPI001C2DED8A|nr:restriction endonuclease subunit S [Pseudomonas viridiflava]MBV1814457.1 restriction endonuclease subunit S [Pseudomonas viridiflava]